MLQIPNEAARNVHRCVHQAAQPLAKRKHWSWQPIALDNEVDVAFRQAGQSAKDHSQTQGSVADRA